MHTYVYKYFIKHTYKYLFLLSILVLFEIQQIYKNIIIIYVKFHMELLYIYIYIYIYI